MSGSDVCPHVSSVVHRMSRRLVLGITGASGAVYGVRLLGVLRAAGCEVHLSISASGRTVMQQELGLDIDLDRFDVGALELPPTFEAPPAPRLLQAAGVLAATPPGAGQVHYHHFEDFLAPIASGSFLTDGMVICPCSGGTLAAIAHGTSENLICRAADVHLKERRKLVLVPRETPLSVIQLDNMKRCAEAGAVVLPAMPGFYHGVERVADLVDFVVARVCDQLGVPHDLMRRWGSPPQ
jgi:4-hydroxy-3-polyprenylbenzoate decarboxylase